MGINRTGERSIDGSSRGRNACEASAFFSVLF